jgi:hypothetical protein
MLHGFATRMPMHVVDKNSLRNQFYSCMRIGTLPILCPS